MQKLKNLETNDIAKVKEENALDILESINWDFSNNTLVPKEDIGPFNCRKYHWFPGTFIPQIPFTLIEVLSLPEATVLDPFSGIGTTFFQALSLNRHPIGVEICDVAVNICKSMLCLFDNNVSLENIKIETLNILEKFDPDVDYSSMVRSNVQVEKLRPWYEPETFNELCFLFYKEDHVTRYMQAAMRIVISSILKMVCSQGRGWGCIADNMLPKLDQIKRKDVFGNFKRSLNLLLNDLDGHKKKFGPEYQPFYEITAKDNPILHHDVRKVDCIRDNTVDLVVTSPPYANMIDYVTSQRLSYYYMGGSIPDDSGIEIGARKRRKRKDSLEKYINDMNAVNNIIFRKLKKGGYACFVMPDFNTDNAKNRDRKKITDNIMESLEKLGLVLIKTFVRSVSSKRRDHNSKWTSLDQEKIYIYRKV